MNPDLNLTIFPSTAYLTVKPGTKITHRVLLRYNGKTALQITPQLLNFKADGLTGTPLLQDQTSIDWITLKSPEHQLNTPFNLQPGKQIELILEIAPPLHTKIAETPLSLVLTTAPTTSTIIGDGAGAGTGAETDGNAHTTGAIASNIIVSVQHDFENKGQLQVEKIELPRFIDSFSTLRFSALAKNVGRNAVAAAGEMKLTHAWSGKELKHWFIYPDVVLAEKTRALRALLTDPQEVKPSAAVEFADLSYKPPFLIGPYKVTIELTSADNDSKATNTATTTNQKPTEFHQRSQTVFAFPFSIVILLILGVIIYKIATLTSSN